MKKPKQLGPFLDCKPTFLWNDSKPLVGLDHTRHLVALAEQPVDSLRQFKAVVIASGEVYALGPVTTVDRVLHEGRGYVRLGFTPHDILRDCTLEKSLIYDAAGVLVNVTLHATKLLAGDMLNVNYRVNY